MPLIPRRASADIRSVTPQVPALGNGAVDAETVAALNRRMAAVEQSLKTLALAIESARTAIAQTDDLVERVVDALELQPREAP
jgi:hypothetical protein